MCLGDMDGTSDQRLKARPGGTSFAGPDEVTLGLHVNVPSCLQNLSLCNQRHSSSLFSSDFVLFVKQ